MSLRVVNLFAGLGGFSEGARQAGATVVWAANHWPLAVRVHAANHPEAEHVCQDLHQADWSQVPEHDILLASPACQGHSPASQGKRIPKHDDDRATAWAVVSCAEVHRPPVVLVENVPKFRAWVLYPAWRTAMEALGYSLAEHLVDAADHGVPQNRRRLFILATRSRSPLTLRFRKARRRPARSFIDLDDPARSWAPVRSKTKGVQARVANGRRNGLGDVFLSQHVTDHPGRSLDRPIGTITTKDHWAVVRGDEMGMLTLREIEAAQGFPRGYLPEGMTKTAGVKLIGNAVPPDVGRDFVAEIGRAA